MKTRALWIVVTLLMVLWWWTGPASFQQRWQPIVEHPLKQLGNARDSYCHPIKCAVG
jgi:hypothetical protein